MHREGRKKACYRKGTLVFCLHPQGQFSDGRVVESRGSVKSNGKLHLRLLWCNGVRKVGLRIAVRNKSGNANAPLWRPKYTRPCLFFRTRQDLPFLFVGPLTTCAAIRAVLLRQTKSFLQTRKGSLQRSVWRMKIQSMGGVWQCGTTDTRGSLMDLK